MTQLLMSKPALMMKTVTTTGIKYIPVWRSMYSTTKFYIMLELKEVEMGKLQIAKKQVVTAAFTNLFLAITLLYS